MIDAGSSGSRAYLYAWPSHSGDVLGNLFDQLEALNRRTRTCGCHTWFVGKACNASPAIAAA